MDDEDSIELTDEDEVEIVGLVYSIAHEAIVITFQCDGGRKGRVLIPLAEFFERATDARFERRQATLN